MKHADHWFFVPDSSSTTVSFPIEEAVHAAKVLRLQAGDRIQWLDGKGGRFLGTITHLDKRSLQATVTSSTKAPQVEPTVLAVGQLHDASRMEWMVEKATELGVTEILLVSTTRVERTRYKMTRLQAKVISAVKQSGRVWVPELREISFAEALTYCSSFGIRYIAHCYNKETRNNSWPPVPMEQKACLFIGPEGDFTLDEVNSALSAGYEPISLGSARLRTETAAIAGLVRLRGLSA